MVGNILVRQVIAWTKQTHRKWQGFLFASLAVAPSMLGGSWSVGRLTMWWCWKCAAPIDLSNSCMLGLPSIHVPCRALSSTKITENQPKSSLVVRSTQPDSNPRQANSQKKYPAVRSDSGISRNRLVYWLPSECRLWHSTSWLHQSTLALEFQGIASYSLRSVNSLSSAS
jgi:hypothetical protein